MWADLHAVVLAVMEELNSVKKPLCLGFTGSRAVASGLVIQSHRSAWKPVLLKGCLYVWGTALW